jgi:hypothetical protein
MIRVRKYRVPDAAERMRQKLIDAACPMEQCEFSLETYNALFPDGKIDTPLGVVKLGAHQFEKLLARERTMLLGALRQTLSDPVFVIQSKDAELYIKSFFGTGKAAAVISVIIKKDGERISISTHRREANNVVNKIKKGNILYEKILPENRPCL